MSEWRADRRDAADAAIDRAVREIMSAEPRPGFGLRVLARLRNEPRTSPAAVPWSWLRLGVVGIVALGIVLAIVLTRPAERRPEPLQTAERAPLAPPPRPAEPRRSPDRSVVPRQPAVARRAPAPTPSEPRMVRAASLSPEMMERAQTADSVRIEPLPAIAPIAVPTVTITPLAALERIDISPLSPPR